jgi:hypothetical protein
LILITTYYDEKNENRRQELLDCLNNNIDNPVISVVHIISEKVYPIIRPSNKVTIVLINARWSFNDVIKYSNKLESNKIKIIANTDIFFNYTLIKANIIKDKEVYCLTRWEYNSDEQLDFYGNFKSQDAWIFKDHLPENIGDYFMGIPGCDNRFAFELKNKGFRLLNPSLSIQAIHLHNTNLRNYNKSNDKVLGLYYFPLPTALGKIGNAQTKRLYLLMRRKYYSSIVTKTLEGVKHNIIDRLLSKLLEVYFKLRIKING